MKRTATLFVLALTVAFTMALLLGVTVFAEPTPGQQVHLPILTWLGDEADACAVVIEVQNVGDDFTKAAILFWGAPGACPPQCNGPFKVECSGLLKPGSTWNFIGPDSPAQVPAGAKKGIVFSLDARQEGGDIVADEVCEALFANVRSDCNEYRVFKKSFDENDGESWWGTPIAGQPLAVEVVRKCQTAEMDAPVVSAYSGISEWELGWWDTNFGGFTFYTPLLYADQDGLNSWVYIQNAGLECTSVEIWLKQQGECIRATIDEIPALAPGETIQYNVSDLMGPFWQGNAWIRTSVPAAIAVDNWSNEVLMTYVGRPAEINFTFDPDQFEFTVGSQVNFGPLIYREHQGWNTNIQVQNLSSVVNAKVKVYFLDNSGDIIKTVVDWICPRGTQTFPLAVIDGLPGNWVGSVRVESQEWWTPGDPKVLPPNIISIAELIRWDGPAQTVLLEGVAYNLFPEWQSYDWQVGWETDFGVDLIGIPSFMNNMSGGGETGLTTELAIQNVVAKPGFTDFAIYIYDQNGLLDFVCEKLNEKQVEYINVADDWNYINDGFKGSAVISVTSWEHHGSYSPGLAAVKVERFNWPLVPSTDPADDAPGDQASASEGFPVPGPFDFEGPQAPTCPGQPAPCTGDVLGTVVAFDYEKDEIDPEGNEPIAGASVSSGGASTTTDGAGTYELRMVPGVSQVTAEGPTSTSTNTDDADVPASIDSVTTTAHFPLTKEVRVACFEDSDLDFTLICKALLCGSVEITGTATPISGATVSLVVDANNQPEGVADSFTDGIYNTSTQTNSTGDYCLEVPLIGDADFELTNNAPWTLTVAATGFNDFVSTGASFADDNAFDSDECFNDNTGGAGLQANTFDPSPVDMCSLGSFSGIVWSDLNGDGAIDAGEPLREGLVVSLIDAADSVVATDTTDVDGFYLFADLDTTKDYRVSVSDIETANQNLACDEDGTIDFDILNDASYVR